MGRRRKGRTGHGRVRRARPGIRSEVPGGTPAPSHAALSEREALSQVSPGPPPFRITCGAGRVAGRGGGGGVQRTKAEARAGEALTHLLCNYCGTVLFTEYPLISSQAAPSLGKHPTCPDAGFGKSAPFASEAPPPVGDPPGAMIPGRRNERNARVL